MNPLAPIANDELADVYCALCSEYVDLIQLSPIDPQYITDLKADISSIHNEIDARGMFEYGAA
ncbi:hypothetical protein [Rhodococcus sp. UFZ-B548]|uniref:hypothetical protein n=1 Tax=Rhodococcus sp. UFZ-B548 TaxID=2742212 RepID=UPI0015F3813F|nr:hypothetical protein [Rhodococcus sp. UFZ-B548]